MQHCYKQYKNLLQAIEILEKTVKSKHVPQLYILLGKTKMKAKLLKEAIDCFGEALRLMVDSTIFVLSVGY